MFSRASVNSFSTKSANPSASFTAPSATTTNPRIKLDLIEAQHAHAIIDIQPEGSADIYQSTILNVDAVTKTIVIDELFPQGFLGKAGQPLTVTLRLAGNRRVSFSTRLLAVKSYSDSTHYHLALPADIGYNQRRETYRFRLSQPFAGTSEFVTDDQFYCAGVVQDISLNGVRLALQHRVALQAGDALPQLTFEFAGLTFQCQADVRNVQSDESGNVAIGVKFRNMPRPQQRSLEQTLARWHREQARQTAAARLASSVN